ncbi:hypothetical protein DFR29_113179 [Tahibacter aquaticus]|uniref:Uncharacterized protein n=1 Tax=Tahibacter aquaticus TaxID=520092 RepID=A0A4R6YR34_9GAMM|nr:hypothetical protein [Tahibacter aquaticus]TDR40477.1 hypothetical protein DFR29_113179 [Tahibacter aquaticus]
MFTPDDLIFSYTRADALRDGELIDVTKGSRLGDPGRRRRRSLGRLRGMAGN